MSWVNLGIALVKLLASITEQFQEQNWFKKGVAAQQAKDAAAKAAAEKTVEDIKRQTGDLTEDDLRREQGEWTRHS